MLRMRAIYALCAHNIYSENPDDPHTLIRLVNPVSPHDALKHHFTSLKTHLIIIFLQPRLLKRKFP